MPNVSSLVSRAKNLYGTAKVKLDGVKKTIKGISGRSCNRSGYRILY